MGCHYEMAPVSSVHLDARNPLLFLNPSTAEQPVRIEQLRYYGHVKKKKRNEEHFIDKVGTVTKRNAREDLVQGFEKELG